MITTELLVLVVSAIMAIISVLQIITKGWQSDKENYSNLSEKYDKSQTELFNTKLELAERKAKVIYLEKELAGREDDARELELLRKLCLDKEDET